MTSSNLLVFGLLLVILGMVIIFLAGTNQQTNVKSSGGIFLGPIPLFGFGDKNLFYVLWAVAVALFILTLIFSRGK